MKFQTVRGMRDFLPLQAAKKQFIEGVCRGVFESYGFAPLETPLVEDFALLSKKGGAGEAIKEEIYCFKDKSGRELGLRFDLTVPLARVVASNKGLPKPFKRYQIGRVYRYDRPAAKRWREFTQADWDIVGSGSVLSDFETIAVAIDVMKGLGFRKGQFVLKINNRKLLEEIALCCGVQKAQVAECFRCLDKLQKQGEDAVRKELQEKGINAQILGQLKVKELGGVKVKNTAPLEEMKKLFELIEGNGLGDFVELDLSLARGLEYYTGMVFEVCLEGSPSVGGGGRYDRLVELYGGQPTACVGGSFGIDRLLDALEAKLKPEQGVRIFVAPIYKELPDWEYEKGKKAKMVRIPGNEIVQYMVGVASKIRALGINCEIDLMMRNIKRNLQNIERKGIPVVVIVGEDELKKREVTIKNMDKKKQKRVKFSDLEKELKSILK